MPFQDTTTLKLAIVATETPEAQHSINEFRSRYKTVPVEEADVIVALGGDGTMLQALHLAMEPHLRAKKLPVYGLNCGSVGFLLNPFVLDGLPDRLVRAQAVNIHPLLMEATTSTGKMMAYAVNEVSLLRETRQAAKLRILVDGKERLNELVCDGALVATAVGSTAYNLSAYGPVLPLTANVMALTPISAFRPRRWRGALLPNTAQIVFDVAEDDKRPVSAVADFTEVRDVSKVSVHADTSITLTLLFDPERHLAERMLEEQFTG
jgi:NAD+ kinase